MGTNLATRAAGAAAAPAGQPSLTTLIEQMRPQMARALPKHMDPDKLARIALTLLRQTPKLGQCTPESFLGALMTCAQVGLEPGPLGEAYLVPYGREVTFIPGYRGLIKLAWQSNMIKTIGAEVVYEADEFTFELGLNPRLEHRPTFAAERGRPIAVYATAHFTNGGHAMQVWSVGDVEKIRKRSRSGTNGPWVSDWDAMAKKTLIKQLIKYLPLSTELRDVNVAANMDESVRTDVTPLDDAQWVEIEADETPAIEPAAPSEDDLIDQARAAEQAS